VIPGILGDGAEALKVAELRSLVESIPGSLEKVHSILAALEDELWAKADFLVSNGDDVRVWEGFAEEASARTSTALVEALEGARHPGSGCGPGAEPA
jgi:hypothetical protein